MKLPTGGCGVVRRLEEKSQSGAIVSVAVGSLAIFPVATWACREPPLARDAPRAPKAIAQVTGDTQAGDDAGPPCGPKNETPSENGRDIGPFETLFAPKRTVYFVIPTSRSKPQRLIANLHGVCNPPGYACGYWVRSASEVGFLVCPTGNARCGAGVDAPPTWTEPFARIDEDLEQSIAAVERVHPGEITRDGAILTGFSLGATAALEVAKRHPNRWPYLVLVEASTGVTAAQLAQSGVRAVAFLAGERGDMLAGERRAVARLTRGGVRARLWIMPGAGHFYSSNIDDIMREAMRWLVESETLSGP